MLITGKARLAGVMGWPVAHSLSPLLHGYWFEWAGVEGAYVPLAVRAEDAGLAFRALPRLGFRGWNVTIPHKEAAFGLVDARDEAAERMGAVNTVLVREDGSLLGRNTDGLGFVASLRAAVPGWRGQGTALLLGTGGGARAVATALLDAGVERLRLVNRTRERAEALAAGLGPRAEVAGWAEREEALAGVDLLVNATSLGMRSQPALALRLDALPAGAVVADLVYVPLLTGLLQAAAARGHRVVDGLGMLLHQAVPGFAHWGGVEPVVDETVRSLLLERLAR
jgi:shikimate dehydrogenase